MTNEGGFEFGSNLFHAWVVKYSGESSNVTIPSVFNGKPVTNLSDRAFSETYIQEVTIPASIKEIGSCCFHKCCRLRTVSFEDDSNLMLEINGHWFYKSPKAKTIDMMSAFFKKPLNGPCDLTLKIFAPPASGENDISTEDGLYNTYTTIEKMPKIRLRFEPVELAK